MCPKNLSKQLFCLLAVIFVVQPLLPSHVALAQNASPYELIDTVNQVRTSNGLPPLEIDNILMVTAQYTSDYMAANNLHSHIGNVRERVAAAGYGGGATVWATENFSMGSNKTIEQVVYTDWADPVHMLPMEDPNYYHIGAGITEIDGTVWYVIHAAYTSGGSYTPNSTPSAGIPTQEIIIPVKTVTPQDDGSIVHLVEPGQALWSIAIAYGLKIVDLVTLNRLSPSKPIIYAGHELLVQASFTPTISPTITETSKPPTRTPRPTSTPRPTRPTRTATITATQTAIPLLPKIPSLESLDNRTIGIGIIFICGIGLLVMIAYSLRAQK